MSATRAGGARFAAALVAVVLSAAVPAGATSVAPPPCAVTGGGWNFTSPVAALNLAQLVGSAPAPDVVVDDRTEHGAAVTRLDGRSARHEWTGGRGDGGGMVVTGAVGRERVTTLRAGDLSCGDVVLTSVDARTGRRVWRTVLGPVTTPERPIAEVFRLAPADWNGDRVADEAVLRSAIEKPVPGFSYCSEQPSGHCATPAASWHATVAVVDGATGRVSWQSPLGEGRGPTPTAMWVGDGPVKQLALAVPRSTSETTVSLRTPRGASWSRTVAQAVGDMALLPLSRGVALVATAATWQVAALGTATHVSALDAAGGGIRWTKVYAGPVLVAPVAGDLVVAQIGTTQVERVHAKDGSPRWQALLARPVTGYLTELGDVDGRGSPELAVSSFDGTTILSTETGQPLRVLAPDERVYRAGDVTGDRRADVVTVSGAQTRTPTVRVRSGATLTERWAKRVTLTRENGSLDVRAGGGRDGTVLVLALDSDHVALGARDGAVRWAVDFRD